MDFKTEMAERTAQIEQIIKKYLPKEEGYQKTIMEAMNYSVLAGGKRLRPMLMQETYRLFGGRSEVIEPFMAAIEMIHTYSLVHDDLPAMDNDEYRRGKKTTHAVYGEAMGILAGDALLNYAYETAARAFAMEQKIIEQTAGEVGLAFQIQDDILDVTSTMEVLGKPIGSDEKNHKITYVTYEGIEKAKADVASLSEQAIARMDSLVVKNEYLTELLRYLILREK